MEPGHDRAAMTASATPPAMTPPPRTAYLARHGSMRFLGEFLGPPGQLFRRGDRVILRTDRGQEVGNVLCPSNPQVLSAVPEPTAGDVLRRLSADDLARIAELQSIQQREFEKGHELVLSHRLAMQIVDVE